MAGGSCLCCQGGGGGGGAAQRWRVLSPFRSSVEEINKRLPNQLTTSGGNPPPPRFAYRKLQSKCARNGGDMGLTRQNAKPKKQQ